MGSVAGRELGAYPCPSMALPPRPPRRNLPGLVAASPFGASSLAAEPARPEPPAPAPLAELDPATRDMLTEAITRAVAESLGHVRISTLPPAGEPEPEPASSKIRTSMQVARKALGKGSKWTTIAVGALAVVGQVIVWFGRPEYASPIVQAIKIIVQAIIAAYGGGPPTGDSP